MAKDHSAACYNPGVLTRSQDPGPEPAACHPKAEAQSPSLTPARKMGNSVAVCSSNIYGFGWGQGLTPAGGPEGGAPALPSPTLVTAHDAVAARKAPGGCMQPRWPHLRNPVLIPAVLPTTCMTLGNLLMTKFSMVASFF